MMVGEPLHVLINACTMPDHPTGIGVYALELATALARRDDCQVVFAAPEPVPPGIERLNPPAISERPDSL